MMVCAPAHKALAGADATYAQNPNTGVINV